jgi:hypothetical protein
MAERTGVLRLAESEIYTTAREESLMKRIPWTPDDIKRLKKLYRNHTREQCAKKLKRPLHTIHNQVYANKFKHSKKFQIELKAFFRSNLLKVGMTYRIKPGGVMPDGTRFIQPKGTYAPGSEKGWFKKGGLPTSTLHDGAIRMRLEKTGHCGTKRLMKFIRTKKCKWIYLKNYIWEKHHGKIPKGMLVAFKNPKNTMNCSLRNLCLITKAESMKRTCEMDEYIAQTLSHPKGKPRGSYDRELYREMLHQPTLLKLKRKELQLRRKLKTNGKTRRK